MATSNTQSAVQEFERRRSRQRSEEDRSVRLESDYKVMHDIVDFFFEVVKGVSTEEQQNIEASLFNGRTSHNKLGTILFLQKFAQSSYPAWVEHAKRRFGIDY